MREKDATFQARLPCANATVTLGRSDIARCALPSQSIFVHAHLRGTAPDPESITDGNWLAACGSSTEPHLWRAPSWEEIEAAENHPADTGQESIISVADFTDNGTVQGKEE